MAHLSRFASAGRTCAIFNVLESDPPQKGSATQVRYQVKSNSDTIGAYFVGVVDQILACSLSFLRRGCQCCSPTTDRRGNYFSVREMESARDKLPSDFIDASGEKPGTSYWDSHEKTGKHSEDR